jgi:hypothetical protein
VSEDVHPDRLAARYRRLLGLYPPEHRARYGEEMIGVLMAASAPGQGWPDIRESLDLVVSGLRVRLGVGVGGGLSPASRSAATVFGFLTSVVLAALSWYQVTADVAWRGLFGAPVPHGWLAQVPHRALAMAAGWTLVACACAAGRRRVAALGAVFGLLGEAVILGREYDFAPDSLVSSWWLLTLITFAAACLVALTRPAPATDGAGSDAGELDAEVGDAGADPPNAGVLSVGGWRSVLRRDPEPLRPLGRRAVVALTAGALLSLVEPFVARALTVIEPHRDNAWVVQNQIPAVPLPGLFSRYSDSHLGAVVLVITLVVLVLRLRPPVRRRVLVLVGPTAATVLLIEAGFQGFMVSSPRFWPPVYLTIGQWSVLVLMPLVVFAAGTWLLHRYERKLASGALLA